LKGFRLHFRSPFLDLSWRYCDELPPFHLRSPDAGVRIAYRSWGCMSGLEVEVYRSFLQRERRFLATVRRNTRWSAG
jgi:hypothetical protein